jgi:autotransporter-associated beta strand protein
LLLSQNVPLGGITFAADASAYTITLTAQNIHFWGSGISNNSGSSQTFVLNSNASFVTSDITFANGASAGSNTTFDNRGFIRFGSTASAGGATFLNRSASAAGQTGPQTNFSATTSADTGTFINFGGTGPQIQGASVNFDGSSTAAEATFSVHGSSAPGAYGAEVRFGGSSSVDRGRLTIHGSMFPNPPVSTAGGYVMLFGNASAGSGVFTVNGSPTAGGTAGQVRFADTATAANATFIVNGGSGGGEGGFLRFYWESSGGMARLKLLGNSHLDISVHRTPGVTGGSIEGTGSVFLGARNLTLGSNNLSTVFSGVIHDGGLAGGSGGSLGKVGSGTLTLSAANTYSGATNVHAGRLLVTNATGSGTGSGAVAVSNSGSEVGGTGTISGPITITTGAALLGGDGATTNGSLRVAADLMLNPGSIIELVLGPSGAHSSLTRTGGSWVFAPNQRFTFLDLGAAPGFYDNIITGLAGDPGGTESWTITNAGFTGTFLYDGGGNIDLILTAATGPSLRLIDAVSRKIHGSAGPRDISLPLTGEPGVESRSSNGNHTLVFSFSNDVVSGNASVISGEGIAGIPIFNGNTMTVNLSGVADVQKITILLSNVRDSLSQVLPDKSVKLNVLIGDTNGNRTVNATDIGQTKSQSGALVTGDNFRTDINASGSVNATDIAQAKANAGRTLPPEL